MIQTYTHKGEGYNPFFITEEWQVAQLNWEEAGALPNIKRLDIHYKTDEVFVLLKGSAVLIAAFITDGEVDYQLQDMEPGVTYNIPANVWHNIVLSKEAQVLIVEKDKTHLGDFEFFYLSEKQKAELDQKVITLNNTVV